MEKSKIKVFVVVQDIKVWQSIKALLAPSDEVEVYPKTEAEFYALYSLVLYSLNHLMSKGIVQDAQQRMKQLLVDQINEETIFVIANKLFLIEKLKINGLRFYQQFIKGNYDAPIILTCKNKKSMKEFQDFKKSGDCILLKKQVNKKLVDLFDF